MSKFNFSTYVAHFLAGVASICFGITQMTLKRTHDLFIGNVSGEGVVVAGALYFLTGLFLASMPFIFKKKRADSKLIPDAILIGMFYLIMEAIPIFVK